eukprot:gene15901-4804_t
MTDVRMSRFTEVLYTFALPENVPGAAVGIESLEDGSVHVLVRSEHEDSQGKTSLGRSHLVSYLPKFALPGASKWDDLEQVPSPAEHSSC